MTSVPFENRLAFGDTICKKANMQEIGDVGSKTTYDPSLKRSWGVFVVRVRQKDRGACS
jgi:hypothetical protein